MSLLSSKNNKCLSNGANRTNLKRLNKDFSVLVTESQVYAESKQQGKKSKLNEHYVVHDVIQTAKTNVTDFLLVINGPVDTLYTGSKIIFKVVIGQKRVYPFAAPSVTCVTSIYHPNIDRHGNICLDILASGWVAGQTLVSIAASLSSFLDEPNPDDPLYPTAANLFKQNRNMYDKKVKEFVSKYATNDEYLRIKQGGSAETKQSHIVEDEVEDDYDSEGSEN